MTTCTRLPAAAPAWVRSVLAGADRPARVVHRGQDAVYLDVGGRCLGVLSTAATAVPCAARTTLPALGADLLAAEHAWVGDGRVLLADTEVVVTRTVDAGVPHLPAPGVPLAASLLATATAGRLDGVRSELPDEALDALAAGRPRAVPALLGRGSGLTPVGDDVLAGWLATVRAGCGDPGASSAVAREVSTLAPRATTLLSATLLDCAVRGDVIPAFRRVLLALRASGAAGAGPAGAGPAGAGPAGTVENEASVDALLRVGHTSGAGLALGTLLALRHLASRSTR